MVIDFVSFAAQSVAAHSRCSNRFNILWGWEALSSKISRTSPWRWHGRSAFLRFALRVGAVLAGPRPTAKDTVAKFEEHVHHRHDRKPNLVDFLSAWDGQTCEACEQADTYGVRRDRGMHRQPDCEDEVAHGREVADKEQHDIPRRQAALEKSVVCEPADAERQQQSSHHMVNVHAADGQFHKVADVLPVELLLGDPIIDLRKFPLELLIHRVPPRGREQSSEHAWDVPLRNGE
mmetsp:Transcript_117726/g.333107  ORF Transcript_117726/g.333107 Transcript_117726/m.333107 type:complete len:234 (+) Transcript_117726:978-1679(+)